jgi:hypothetical protein
MTTKKENIAIVGAAGVACAACCAAPLLGTLAAIGVGTAAGVALFGTVALAIGVVATVIVLRRRRRRAERSALQS